MSEQTIDKSKSNGAGKAEASRFTIATHVENSERDEVELVIEKGIAKQVSLNEIEKGLTALWQAAAKTTDGGAQQAVMRACVFNLIICVEGDDQLEEVTHTIAQITYDYPCRAIVLVRSDETPADSLNAYISAHCQIPGGSGRKVCCEQITITGAKSAAEALHSMVLPLLVPELPVIMWWPNEPEMDEPLFLRLLETVDRLIVDSRTFQNPSRSFHQLTQLHGSEYETTAFSDLSWGRLTPWRSTLAQFFDYSQFLPYLSNIERVEIQYEAPDDSTQPNFSEALLFVGWLANQLNWQSAFNIQRKGMNATLILNQRGTPLPVQLFGHNDRKDELGGITQVKIYASRPGSSIDEWIPAVFTVTLTEDYERAMATIEENNETVKTRSALFPRRTRTELLTEDLTVVGHDTVFEKSLALAGEFNAK